jgi:hypothetical protein
VGTGTSRSDGCGEITATRKRRGGDAWTAPHSPLKAKASAHVRRYGRGGSRRNGGLRCFREHAITLKASPPDAGGSGSDLAGCTPGLG